MAAAVSSPPQHLPPPGFSPSLGWEDTANLHPFALLDATGRDTATFGFSMASGRLTGSLLRAMAASKRGGAMLQLGTGTGLSTAWFLDGVDSRATLLTVGDPGFARAILMARP
jgi:hypothetical protein